MKKMIVMMMLCCSIAVMAQNNHHNFGWFGRYAQANKELPPPAKGEKRVVFMGNSITDNWASMRPDFFKKNGYVGRGIGGQTSFQFLTRFREDVVNLQPKLVVINYGTNDIAENTGDYNEDYTYGNVLSMIDIARANGIKVILTSCLPAEFFPWQPRIKDSMEKIRHLNARVEAYAKANKIPYVDYFNAMLSADGKGLDSRYTPEQVHPNDAGYEEMESLIVPAIKKALKIK